MKNRITNANPSCRGSLQIILEYALSTKRCMLGNLLCSPVLSPLEVVSRAMYDDFTQLNEVRNFSRMHSTIFATFSRPFGGVSL